MISVIVAVIGILFQGRIQSVPQGFRDKKLIGGKKEKWVKRNRK